MLNFFVCGIIFLIILIALMFTKNAFGFSTKPKPEPTPVVTPTPKPSPVKTGSIAELTYLADESACSRVNWKDRGVANKGYFRGLTLTYVRQLCNPTPMISRPMSLNQRLSDPKKGGDGKMYYTDVIAHYEKDLRKYSAQPFTAAGFTDIANGGLETFRAMMTLVTGLGMRESSGQPFVGRDASADFTHENSAESGLNQGSYGLVKDSPEVMELYAWFKKNPKACFKDVYYNGRKGSAANLKNWGTPGTPGYEFQKFKKECPGFDVESTLMAMRYNGGGKGEWGPLRSKDAQVVASCAKHYSDVQAYVEKNLGICSLL